MRAAPLALTACLALAACGDGNSNAAPSPAPSAPASVTTPAATSTAPPIEEADVDRAVLRLSDLPTGWSVSTDDDDESGKVKSSKAGCADRWQKIDDAEAPIRAEVDFKRGNRARLNQSVAAWNGPADITVDGYRQLIADCPKISRDGVDLTYGELSFPALGDRSVAFAIDLEAGDEGSAEVVAVIAEKNGFSVATFLIESFAPDNQLLEQATRTALSRI